jgi:peptidyl-dipeptidase Dcp
MNSIFLNDITIRTHFNSEDLKVVAIMHDQIYSFENSFGPQFINYVKEGLEEFLRNYDPTNNRVWIAEYKGKTVGFIFLMNRGKTAQLRYFLIDSSMRGIGLGKKMMNLFMEFLKECKYESCYLWTVNELRTAAHLYISNGFKLVEEKESTAFGKLLIEQKYELIIPH